MVAVLTLWTVARPPRKRLDSMPSRALGDCTSRGGEPRSVGEGPGARDPEGVLWLNINLRLQEEDSDQLGLLLALVESFDIDQEHIRAIGSGDPGYVLRGRASMESSRQRTLSLKDRLKHRQNALNSFEAFYERATREDTKNAVLLEATCAIYAPLDTGYGNGDSGQAGTASVLELVRSTAGGGEKS